MKIIGDYHTHTDNSDGKNTIEEMVRTAAEVELKEVAITDHGHGKLFGGLSPKKYSMMKALVEKSGVANNIKTYFGVEANVTGTSGQIDVVCQDDGKCVDILLCGIHRIVKPANPRSLFTFFIPNWFWGLIRYIPRGRKAKNTEVMKRVIKNNPIDIWTHPNRYFRLNVVEVAKVCAERGTLIELNGKSISFRPIDFERMLAVGAKFIIGSDAHRASRIADTGNIETFLKLCDYKEDDIINLNGTFRRAEPIQIPAEAQKGETASKTILPTETAGQESKKQKHESKKIEKKQKKNKKKKKATKANDADQ